MTVSFPGGVQVALRHLARLIHFGCKRSMFFAEEAVANDPKNQIQSSPGSTSSQSLPEPQRVSTV